jgi:small conductance mechanosensitive channel
VDINSLVSSIDEREILWVVVSLLVVALVTWLLIRVAQSLIDRLVGGLFRLPITGATHTPLSVAEQEKRRRTLSTLGGGLARIGILILAGIAVLAIFQVDLGPVIAALGLLGLGIGLGLQNLVRDVVAGTFILVENQYATGDYVDIAGVAGTVEELGLRRTVLRDVDGTVHSVPNGQIIVASNHTRAWARIIVDVPIKDPADLDRAQEIARNAATSLSQESDWSQRFLEPPSVTGVLSMTGGGVTLQAQAMVVATDRRAAAAELRRRIVTAFAAEHIVLGDLPPGWTVPRL